MRIALVKVSAVYASFLKAPLGLAYLQGILRQNGHQCEIFDAYNFSWDEITLVNKVKKYQPDLIGFTTITSDVKDTAETAKKMKKEIPVSIVAGGPHVTALPKGTLGEFPSFDFAIYGEGEKTLLELVNTLVEKRDNFEEIKGLVFRKNGQVIQNESRPQLTEGELDELPFPEFDNYYSREDSIFTKKKPFEDLGTWKTKGYNILTSRGCPFDCVFCMRVFGKKVRRRSPESVIAEMEYAIERYKVDSFTFTDEVFLSNTSKTRILLNMMIERNMSKRVKWSAMTRVNFVNKELISKARQAGCVNLQLGIESGDNEILKAIGKNITVDEIKRAVSIIKEEGITTGAFFILGHPNETKETIKRTIKLAIELNTSTVAIGIMVPFPGTEIYRMAQNNECGYRLLSRDWSLYDKYGGQVLEIENLPLKTLQIFQLRGYMSIYLKNFRLLDFTRLLLTYRQTAFHLIRRLLPSKPSS